MTIVPATLGIALRRLAPAIGLVLLAVLFVGGTHHHADGGRHACAVCTANHAPAVAAPVATAAESPGMRPQMVVTSTPSDPRQVRLETASSRAPPLA